MKLMYESTTPRLKFVKESPDQYFIYDGADEVGYMWCKNYYSGTKNRMWYIRIELGTYKMDNTAYTLPEAKQVAIETYMDCLEYRDRSEKAMEGDY